MLDTLSRILGLHTLKHRLRFWVGSIIVVLGLLVLATNAIQETRTKKLEINRQLKETMSLQRQFIDSWMDHHSSQIRYLSRMVSGPAKSREQISQLFDSFIVTQDEFAAVVYVDPYGITAVDTNGIPGVDIADRDYFRAAKEGKELITDVLVGRSSGKPVVIFSSPVTDESGRFNGLVFGSVPISSMEGLMGRLNYNEAGETYLLQRNGLFITSPRDLSALPLKVANRSYIYERASGNLPVDEPYRSYSSKKVMGQYSWIKDGQWLIVAEVEHASVFNPLYLNMLTMTGIVIAVLIMGVMLAIALTKRIERPIRFLLIGTKIMRDGNYDYRIARDEIETAPEELQQLCDMFNATAQKLKSTIQMLEQSAVIDQLTEVYNRRFIMNEGNMLLETCIRADQPCSVLMIDIDFFKKVNDTYGHLVGDRVIIYAASILLACIRSCDMVSRYGGEEFLILAPNTEAAPGGLQLGERIRRFFEDNPYREEGIEIPLTVSIGVADYRRQTSLGKNALEDMISRADEALYKAKRNGRNRVEQLDPAGPEAESEEA